MCYILSTFIYKQSTFPGLTLGASRLVKHAIQATPSLFSKPGEALSVAHLGFVVQNGVDGESSAGSVITPTHRHPPTSPAG